MREEHGESHRACWKSDQEVTHISTQMPLARTRHVTPLRLENAAFQCVQEELEIVWHTQSTIFAIVIQQREEKWCAAGEETGILGVTECPGLAHVEAWKNWESLRCAELEGGCGAEGVWVEN